MAVAKRQGREKPVKIEQRTVRGSERGPRVEQTALLAGPVYKGRPRGREKHIKRGPKLGGGLSSLCVFLGRPALEPQGCIFLYFLNKTEL